MARREINFDLGGGDIMQCYRCEACNDLFPAGLASLDETAPCLCEACEEEYEQAQGTF